MAIPLQGIKTCKGCKHSFFDFSTGATECRAHPPDMKVFIVGQTAKGPQFLEYSSYPKLDIMKPCGEWSERVGIQKEEDRDEEERSDERERSTAAA